MKGESPGATRLPSSGPKHISRTGPSASSASLTSVPSPSRSIGTPEAKSEAGRGDRGIDSRQGLIFQLGSLRLPPTLCFTMKCLSMYFRLKALGTVCAEDLAFS